MSGRGTGMDVDHAIEEFFTSLVAERGLAANTIQAYRRDLRQYRRYLAGRAIDGIEDVAAADVSGYVEMLWMAGAAPATVSRKVAAVRGLHRFLVAGEPVRPVCHPLQRSMRTLRVFPDELAGVVVDRPGHENLPGFAEVHHARREVD